MIWSAQRALHGGRLKEAERTLQAARRLQPANGAIHHGVGKLANAQRDTAGAKEAFVQAIRLDPVHAEAWFDLGMTLNEMGETAAAAECFATAAQHDPDDRLAAPFMLALLGRTHAPEIPPAAYVRNLFDAFASTFDRHLLDNLAYRGPEIVRDLLMRHVPDLAERSVIDLGCGTGLCALILRGNVGAIDGVDISERMLAIARQREIYRDLFLADLVREPIVGAAKYTVAIAADVLIYMDTIEPIFRLMSHHLAPGGFFAFTCEESLEAPNALLASGRYGQSCTYIRQSAARAGYRVRAIEDCVVRREAGQPVRSFTALLQRR